MLSLEGLICSLCSLSHSGILGNKTRKMPLVKQRIFMLLVYVVGFIDWEFLVWKSHNIVKLWEGTWPHQWKISYLTWCDFIYRTCILNYIRLTSGYIHSFIETKWIVCLDLGPSLKISTQIFQNVQESEAQTISGSKHLPPTPSGLRIEPRAGLIHVRQVSYHRAIATSPKHFV